jgi:protein-S-isoprenylcysteine O-methyltransferase Ste14
MAQELMNTDLLLLAISWLGYFFIHSLLASIRFKQFVASHWPGAMPAYRLGYNVLAVLLLLVPLWLTLTSSGRWLWQWNGVGMWLANGLAILALIGFIWSLKHYDGSEFIGLRQLSQRITEVDDQEQFQLSPLHRWVRHPWYFFGLLLIWTRDMNAGMLLSAIMMTLYFVIGSRLEERKLIRYHGEKYRRYCELVPGLIPLAWKPLSLEQMKDLLEEPAH